MSDAAVDFGELPRLESRQLDQVCAGSESLRRRILQEYLKSTPGSVQGFLSMCEAGDLNAASDLAHSLGGGSLTIGAIRLGQMCRKFECRKDVAMAARIAAEHGAVLSEIETWLSGG
jgi:HPt (histidine-containing phosphotransfer) domain-containing protein